MSQTRPERLRIFIGCEGPSEQSYVAWLHRLADDHGRPVHLDGHVLTRGDPLSRIEYAIRILPGLEARRGDYGRKFALLDFDQVANLPERLRQTIERAAEAGITIIWQRPSHEGLLLKHIEGFDGRNLATSEEALDQIGRAWAGYHKNLPSLRYGARLGLTELRRAAGHNHALADLLALTGLLPGAEV